jgi:hypothetical protein
MKKIIKNMKKEYKNMEIPNQFDEISNKIIFEDNSEIVFVKKTNNLNKLSFGTLILSFVLFTLSSVLFIKTNNLGGDDIIQFADPSKQISHITHYSLKSPVATFQLGEYYNVNIYLGFYYHDLTLEPNIVSGNELYYNSGYGILVDFTSLSNETPIILVSSNNELDHEINFTQMKFTYVELSGQYFESYSNPILKIECNVVSKSINRSISINLSYFYKLLVIK